MRALIAIVAIGLCAPAHGEPARDGATARHLLTGVRAFKEGRYEDALVELRIVARAADAPPDLAFYLGPTLYKLGRHREALAVFVTSRAAPDALTELYLGQTYYQLRLYRKARAVFVGLRDRGLGPVLEEAVTRHVEAIDAAYQQAPEPVALELYIAEGQSLIARDPVIAAEYLDEARLAETLGRDRAHHSEIIAALGTAWNAAARPNRVVDVLGSDGSLPPEGTWQLARAHVALGDAARARPLLAEIAKAHGAHAADAAELLAKLPP
jgi:tetratricopeptide (TPR) repeat protein